MTRDPLLLLLMALTVYRLTRLVVRDKLTEPIRKPLEGWVKAGENGNRQRRRSIASPPGYEYVTEWHVATLFERTRAEFAFLILCPWCLSVWIACGVALAWLIGPDVTQTFCAITATAAVAGLLLDRDNS